MHGKGAVESGQRGGEGRIPPSPRAHLRQDFGACSWQIGAHDNAILHCGASVHDEFADMTSGRARQN
jgi:hypothetical protein